MYASFLLWIRLSICSLALFTASIFDLVEREIPDSVWLSSGPLLALLTALWLYREPALIPMALLSMALAFSLSVALFYSGLMGGADSKAIALVAIAFPLGPGQEHRGPLYVHPFLPLASFLNALALSTLMAFYMLFRNLAWKLRTGLSFFGGLEGPWYVKALVLLSGYKVEARRLLELKDVFPLELVEEAGGPGPVRRRLALSMGLGDEERLEALREAVRKGLVEDYVWISPGLPMVAFITVGFLLAYYIGDLLTYALRAILTSLLA